MAAEIDWLHQVVMWIILVIFVGVFGFMFYACYAHRRSVGHKAEQFHENTTVEILWTVIPALILIVIAWPVTKTVIAQKDTSAPDLTIKVTRLPVEMGLRLPEGRARASASSPRCPRRASRSRARRRRARTCWKSTTRWWCRWARRCA